MCARCETRATDRDNDPAGTIAIRRRFWTAGNGYGLDRVFSDFSEKRV